MRKTLLVCFVLGVGCSPSIPKSPTGAANSPYVTVEFDPGATVPIVPTPNDLAFQGTTTGRLNLPVSGAGLSNAQIEFNQYLNTLDGFPLESVAAALTSAPVDDASLTPATVPVFDLGPAPAPGAPVSVTQVTPVAGLTRRYNADTHAIEVLAPASGWTRGHLYAAVVYGGAKGVKSGEKQVVGSAAWALLRSTAPLVKCTSATSCTATTDVIPSDKLDPAERAADQAAKAKQLELLRQLYKPLIDAASVGHSREDVALAWTFRAQTHAELTFDPADNIIPFPNDLVRTGENGTVQLPFDAGLPNDLVAGLNTLDGFSTTGVVVSENGNATPALLGGTVDPAVDGLDTSASSSPIRVMAFASNGTSGPDAGVTVCLTASCGISPTLLDGGTKPELLGLRPQHPLTEKTTYAVFIVAGANGLKDSGGTPVTASPAFALLRSASPLYDASTKKSLVTALTDTQAAALEHARAGYKIVFDALSVRGVPREALALAWTFTTQSTVSTLAQLAGAPTAAQLPTTVLAADVTDGGLTTIEGEMVDLFALTSPVGTFNAGLAGAQPQKVSFTLVLPGGTPSAPYPVTIFGHGLGHRREDVLAIGTALTGAGQAVIAVDEPWHGDRNTCVGFGAYLNAASGTSLFTDDAACRDSTEHCNATTGRCEKDRSSGTLVACTFGAATADLACIQADQGRCSSDNKCEGGAFGQAVSLGPSAVVPVSGWKLLNLANLFATRDNFRQQVITQAQLERILATGTIAYVSADGTTPASVAVDPQNIHYVGQSLGGILGALSNAVSSKVENVALNVPGGDLEGILFQSDAFKPQRDGFVAALSQAGIEQNSPAFDSFFGLARWILDPADPLNAAYYLTHSRASATPNLPAGRHAFIQWIEGDQTIPNATTQELVGAATVDPAAPVYAYQFTGTSTPYSFDTTAILACVRHEFLLISPPDACQGSSTPATGAAALTSNAQSQVVDFITTGTQPF